MRQYVARLVVAIAALLPFSLAAQEGGAVPDSCVGETSPAASPLPSREATVDSSFVVSLLTCSPGEEVYELYGHTALRVRRECNHFDVVFNYGAFDFATPNFVWRFMMGQTDYMLLPQYVEEFLMEYDFRGSSVVEQELNLTPAEAERIALALIEESRPENHAYRYNIFRNNCTTRARDRIEAGIDGRVVYPVRPRRNTFRTILHQYTDGHPWAREGNDLLLGAEVDTLLCERDEMFAPIYMMNYADSAMIDFGRGRFRPLVRARRKLLAADPQRRQAAADAQPSLPFSPAACGWGMLALGLCLAAFELRRRRIVWPVDAVLLTLQGVAGLLLVVMALWSEHPAVGSNWQVWVFNPLPLVALPFVVRADVRRQPCAYHPFAAVYLTAFLALYALLPQDFSTLTLPLALLLLCRAVVHWRVYR